MDINDIRKDFPILSRDVNGNRLIYLDSAATSLKPISVIKAMENFYHIHDSNIARGIHKLSQEATELYEEARDAVAKFIGAKREEIIFTSGTTDSLNYVAFGWAFDRLKAGDEIILTIMEHHSNLLPWWRLAQLKKIKIKYVDIKNDGTLNVNSYEQMLSEKTKMIAVVHMSNVLGTINNIKQIAKIAHEVNAIVVVDGAQSVPHLKVNVKDLDCDFLAFSGHKMLGPYGIGVLWGREEVLSELSPYRLGGGIVDVVSLGNVNYKEPPHKFEAGTPNIAGAVGLNAAIKYLLNIGLEKIRRHELNLTSKFLKMVDEEIGDYVKVYGPKNLENRGGIISFSVKDVDCHIFGSLLDSYGIAVRTGMHCAHPLHKRLGVSGTVRASFYLYNTLDEVEIFISLCGNIIKQLEIK